MNVILINRKLKLIAGDRRLGNLTGKKVVFALHVQRAEFKLDTLKQAQAELRAITDRQTIERIKEYHESR